MVALNLGLQLALLIATGFTVRKLKILPDNFDGALATLLLNVMLPCLILRSLNIEFSLGQLGQLGMTLLVSFGTILFLFLLGQLFFYICAKDATGRIIRFGMMFSNFTFFGFPMVESLYGASGLFMFTIFTLPVRLVYYISPLFLFKSSAAEGSDRKKALPSVKQFFSPPLIAVLIGLVLYFANIRLPMFLSNTISSIAGVCSPLGMFLSGMLLSRLELKRLFRSVKMLLLVLGHTVIAPLCVLLVTMLIGIEPQLIKTAVMYVGLPAASLLPTFAMQYEGSYETAAQGSVGVFLSTVLCIVTLPVWSVILERVLSQRPSAAFCLHQ